MTDLEALRAEAPPRSSVLSKRLAGRIDSVWGFIAYGILWLFAAGTMASVVLSVGISLTGKEPSPAAAHAVLFACGLSFLLAWVPFGAWVARRRASARRVFQMGVIVEGVIEEVHHLTVRGAPFTHAAIRFDAGGRDHRASFSVPGHPSEIVAGAPAPVLFASGAAHCAVFPLLGKAVAARNTGGRS